MGGSSDVTDDELCCDDMLIPAEMANDDECSDVAVFFFLFASLWGGTIDNFHLLPHVIDLLSNSVAEHISSCHCLP